MKRIFAGSDNSEPSLAYFGDVQDIVNHHRGDKTTPFKGLLDYVLSEIESCNESGQDSININITLRDMNQQEIDALSDA